ncbi:MAG: hypothetical protein Q7R31_00190 [Candidatus Levybacteria bacterium]|nr:hypothetical protein [Candidatus Levybacteria bacterium]
MAIEEHRKSKITVGPEGTTIVVDPKKYNKEQLKLLANGQLNGSHLTQIALRSPNGTTLSLNSQAVDAIRKLPEDKRANAINLIVNAMTDAEEIILRQPAQIDQNVRGKITSQ